MILNRLQSPILLSVMNRGSHSQVPDVICEKDRTQVRNFARMQWLDWQLTP